VTLQRRLPSRRPEWPPGEDPSVAERELLKKIVDASEKADLEANYVLRPGDAAWRALALDVLRIEEGIITEIVTFAGPNRGKTGLPLTIDEQAGGERRPRVSQ
jgi:hypothetical protein